MSCSFPRFHDIAGMMRLGHDQSTKFETPARLSFIVAAVGRPPHFYSTLKSAALCREAATPVLQRPPFQIADTLGRRAIARPKPHRPKGDG